jgi:RNA polymerase sigma-70 factor, ECF subfamily
VSLREIASTALPKRRGGTLSSVGLSLVERPAPQTDAELIAACVAGDVAAQRLLFRREYPRVSATVFRIVGSSRDADDLVQETFIAVFRGLPRFRGDAKLATWIDRIAVRVVFHRLRANKRLGVVLDAVDPEIETSDVQAQAHARDGLRRLYGVLAELTPETRTAFALFAIDGRSIAEVAKLTQTTLVAAKCRIWRARRELTKRAAEDPVLAELVRGADEDDSERGR